MSFPFEIPPQRIPKRIDELVDSVFALLESEFLEMPKGLGFIDYATFEAGYEALKQATDSFDSLDPTRIVPVALERPMVLIVLRAMLGFTPPELAYVASRRTETVVSQSAARSLDRKIRLNPRSPVKNMGLQGQRVAALVAAACEMLTEGCPAVEPHRLHRLDKADTKDGLAGVRAFASIGAPYAMLLYERMLGRPFAGHRDSISELIGDELESLIEIVLHNNGISFRKTRRAEKIANFDQAPDFIVPSEFNPQVVIEAKKTEDDGTARDKITRIQHLAEIGKSSNPKKPKFEVVACIAGRGFGVRRADMAKLIVSTQGKVFTPRTLDRLVECTRLRKFKTKEPPPMNLDTGEGATDDMADDGDSA